MYVITRHFSISPSELMGMRMRTVVKLITWLRRELDELARGARVG